MPETSNFPSKFCLHCQPLGVSLQCYAEAPMAQLLSGVLSGWELRPTSAAGGHFDVRITCDSKVHVDAPAVSFSASHKDLVSSVNELLIAIAYLVCHQRPDLLLIHAGAMINHEASEQQQNILLLGGHKAGKSTYLATQCQHHGSLVSDDLLLIDESGNLLGLGFPLRLRRPIDEAIVAGIGAENILAGHSLAYLGPKAMPIYAAGKALHVDQVLLLENYQAHSLPQTQWLAMIEQRIVPIPTACDRENTIAAQLSH